MDPCLSVHQSIVEHHLLHIVPQRWACDSINSYTTSDFAKNSRYFGDGSDGPVTYNDGAEHVLTKDMYYITLTLESKSSVSVVGFRFIVAITGDGTGFIHYNGNS